jgi:hypothetical protein
VRRGPLAALAVLALPFVVLVLVWALREPPSDPCLRNAFSDDDPDAWLAGLAPAAFAAGCYCAALIFWLSGRTRGGEPSRLTVATVAAGLAAGGVWWAGGGTVGFMLVWPVLAFVLLIPSVILVPGLILAIVVSPEQRAWAILRALAWWSALVLIPGFVVAVDMWHVRLHC